MKFLYLSTDAQEAKELVDSSGTKDYAYANISIKDGEELAKRTGFNPMSSIAFNGSTSYKTIEDIASGLSKKGPLVAIDSFASIKKIFLKDMESRNQMLTLALQEKYHLRGDSRKSYNLFLYSNNPNKIRKD